MSRTAFVTGASSGIGAAIGRRLIAGGYTVFGFDLQEGPADSCSRFLSGDVTDPAAVAAAIGACVGEAGALHCIVPCAGITMRGLLGDLPGRFTSIGNPIAQLSLADTDRVIDVNIKGAMNVCREAIPHVAPGGSIVLLSSNSSLRPSAGMTAYCASKGAIDALTRALAVELAPDVRVNAVLPGLVDTPIWTRSGLSEADWDRMKEVLKNSNLLRRIGRPEDIANAVAFLASDEAAWMTGVLLEVNGGGHLK